MSSIINFDYKGSQISFNNGEKVMVNATQMARPFNKEPKFWLMNQSTTDYLTELSKVRNLTLTDLVQVTKGGNNPGTWMHEDVALEFARWLSPAFAIWCNDRIKELLRTGVTTVSNDDEAIAYAMQVLNKRLEQAKQEKAMLEQQNTYLTNEIKETAPKNNKFLFGYLNIITTFAVLKVGELNHPAGQAVNLLNSLLGYFYARTLGYWRLPIRKLRLAFRGEVHRLSAAYMAAAFLLPVL